ncbi:MAG: phenylalanine--tRNA ligase subunit beta [Clostridium sp.]
MKAPIQWLNDYVNIDVSPKTLGDALTLSGSKVEGIEITGDEITNVVTGRIEKIESHPEADKLVVCDVNIGTEHIQIVTAATNMKEQDVVPVALHGSTLHGGLKIKKGKLRGVLSQGMFCSEAELGLADEKDVDGLMILAVDTVLGEDIKKVLGLESAVIDFEITSNRPDCLGLIGIAREVAATLGTTYKRPSGAFTCDADGNINDDLKVEVKDRKCVRYMAREVKNIKIVPSPKWMQDRLLEAGVRPINNIVDITNFAMLEFAQPMHAFDIRDLSGKKIIVENANIGEKFVTLDGEERNLDSDVLCIKDADKTIAIAGIMGGLNSEVKEDTATIILECASFEPVNIRNSSKRLGLRTESSSRFEKEIDPNGVVLAMDRACSLIQELGAGEIVEGTIDIYTNKKESYKVKVSASWINAFLGTDIHVAKMKQCLDSLDLDTEVEGDTLIVTSPTFRCDIAIREDIAEEIARIYGYNKIPATIPSCETLKGGKNAKQLLDDKVIESMLASGLNQSISYSFVSPKIFDKLLIAKDSPMRNVVKIKNPLGEDYSVMRTTSISSMMESLGRNYNRSNESASLFEIGKVYIPDEDTNKIPYEKNIITIGIYGGVDYLNLKGIVENLLDNLGVKNPSFRREEGNPSFHPGKTASLYVRNKFVGVIGEVHPDVAENFDIEERSYIAELDLDLLYEASNLEKKYKALPKFPAVTRDIAILVDDTVLVQEIDEIIRKAGGNILESIKLFDVYKGKQIPEDKKSIAYALVYRAEGKTLKDEEVGKVHDKILRSLEHKLGAVLR